MSQTEHDQQAQQPVDAREDMVSPLDTDMEPPLGGKSFGEPMGSDDLVSGSVMAEDWGRMPAEDPTAEETVVGGVTREAEG